MEFLVRGTGYGLTAVGHANSPAIHYHFQHLLKLGTQEAEKRWPVRLLPAAVAKIPLQAAPPRPDQARIPANVLRLCLLRPGYVDTEQHQPGLHSGQPVRDKLRTKPGQCDRAPAARGLERSHLLRAELGHSEGGDSGAAAPARMAAQRIRATQWGGSAGALG